MHFTDHIEGRITPKLQKRLTLFLTLLVAAILTPSAVAAVYIGPGWELKWWYFALTIAIEAVAIWLIFKFSWKRAISASALVNSVTAVCGVFVYVPVYFILAGMIGSIIIDVFGDKQVVETIAVMIGIALIDTGIELFVLATAFKTEMSWRKTACYTLVNFLTVGIGYYVVTTAAI